MDVFFLESLNPSKNYFQHAVVKYQVLTAVPSKKQSEMSNILRIVSESHDNNFYKTIETKDDVDDTDDNSDDD